jgi:hypothetical protein
MELADLILGMWSRGRSSKLGFHLYYNVISETDERVRKFVGEIAGLLL